MAQDRRALSGVIKTAHNIIRIHLPNINYIAEVRCLTPKDTERQRPLQPQPVHLGAIWQAIQKYVLPYHHNTGQFISSGYVTPKLNLFWLSVQVEVDNGPVVIGPFIYFDLWVAETNSLCTTNSICKEHYHDYLLHTNIYNLLSIYLLPLEAQIYVSYVSLFCPLFYAALSHVVWVNILTTEITASAPGCATSTLREQQQSRLNLVPGRVITEYMMGMQGHLDLQSQVLALQLTASSIIDRGKPIRTICSPQRSARAA